MSDGTVEKVDLVVCGNVSLLFYRDPIRFTAADVEFLRERGILAMKSKNLGADVRVVDIHTTRYTGPLDLISEAAVQSVGYNTTVFASKLLELVKQQKAQRATSAKS